MADKNQGFDEFVDLWKQGQEAFIKSQTQMADHFKTSMDAMNPAVKKPDESNPFVAWQSFLKAWAPTWEMPDMTMPQPSAGYDFSSGKDAFFAMLDPQKWSVYGPDQLRVMLESIANGPQFADLMMPQQSAANAWRETLDFQKAAADMASVMQEAWTAAYATFSEKYTIDDLKSGNVDGALDAWLVSANAALLEAQGSASFLDAQKRIIRASTEIRARQRDIAEKWSENWQMPTRTEIDDLVLTVHQLRRELRELKRELATFKGGRE